MYKTSVYTLVNGNIEELTHRKQQKSEKVILSALHSLSDNVSKKVTQKGLHCSILYCYDTTDFLCLSGCLGSHGAL